MSFNGSNKGFLDSKEFRKCILEKANQRLGVVQKEIVDGNGTLISKDLGMLNLLDSSYSSDVPSTLYAKQLEANAFESGRFLCTTETITNDMIFTDTRGEYLIQNIASFLFPDGILAQTSSSDAEVRRFYLAIIQAFFGGSTKANIESSLINYLNVPVTLIENFLLCREIKSLDEIAKKFTFVVDVTADDPRIKDINKLLLDIKFLLSIIKPAHVFYETILRYSETWGDAFGKGCIPLYGPDGLPIVTPDGFDTNIKKANTAVCETIHTDLFNYFYEDVRKQCTKFAAIFISREDITNQSSPRYPRAGISQTKDFYHTKFGPIGKVTGSIADSVTDVSVYVNDVRVDVLNIFPLSGVVQLRNIPLDTDIVTIDYYSLKDYVTALTTNNFDSVLNGWGGLATLFDYKVVLPPTNYTPASNQTPIKIDYKYKGFDLYYSSVLNCPESLVLNHLGVRNKLNDSKVFKSAGYDLNIYNTTLNDTTSLVPVSLTKKDVWRRLPYQEFRMNNTEFLTNIAEDRLFGEIHQESHHPFYSALDVSSKNNGGEENILATICEDQLYGMAIDFQILNNETVVGIGQDYENRLMTLSGYTNDLFCVLFGANQGHMDIVLDYGTVTTPLDEPVTKLDELYVKLQDIPTVINPNTGMPYDADAIWPMHISDLANEYYCDYPYFQSNDSILPVTASGFDYLFGKKLKESELSVSYDYLNYTINPLTMNYIDHTDEIILKCGDYSLFRFYAPHNILLVTEVRNVTQGAIYDLTNMILVGDKIIDLDETNITNIGIGLNAGDEIRATFRSIDRINDNLDLISIFNIPGFKFMTPRDIATVSEVYNATKDAYYNLTNMLLVSNRTIDLDETLPENISIGLDINDIVYASFTTVDPLDEIEPLLNGVQIKQILTNITVSPV